MHFWFRFLQSSDSVVEELLFLVFQPAICRADNVLVVRNFVSFHEFFQFRKKQKSLGARTTYLITRTSAQAVKHWLPSKMPALNYSVTHRHRRRKVCKSVWTDKAPRLRRPRRRHRGAQGAKGVGCGEGLSPLEFFTWNCMVWCVLKSIFANRCLHDMITITPSLLAPLPTVFAIRIRTAWQTAGWKTKNNNSSTTESELWRNAGLGRF